MRSLIAAFSVGVVSVVVFCSSSAKAASLNGGVLVNNVCLAPSGAWWAYPAQSAQPVGTGCAIASTAQPGTVVAGWISPAGVWVSNLCRAGAAWWLWPANAAQPLGTTCRVGPYGPFGIVSNL
jgi:hypothetical protein